MKSLTTICPKLIANFLLLATIVLCLGFVANAKPTTPLVTSKTSFAPCLLAVSPLTHTSPGTGENFTVNVIVIGAGCSFGMDYSVVWFQASQGASNVYVNVSANPGPQRTAQLSIYPIYNQTALNDVVKITITQPPLTCSYSISPNSLSVGNGNGFGYVQVTASSELCPRNAVSNSSWLTVTSGNQAAGNGPIGYSIQLNQGPARIGKITLGNATFTVTQGNGCDYSFGTTSKSFDANGGSGAINVTASNSACPRNATSNANWLTIVGGNNSVGSGPLTYNVAANSGSARTGQIKLGGETFTVTQASAQCSFGISPGNYNFGSAGGEVSVNVSASQSSCKWYINSASSFISVVTGGFGGVGNGAVKLKVQPNAGAARAGSIEIAGKTFSVTQDGANPATMMLVGISPGFASVGGKEFLLGVKGANFTSACKVRWNGKDRPTTFYNNSTLVAAIPASDIASEGAFNVTVSNPNGDETNAEAFMVYGAVANVSSASFKGESLAPASLVSAFGVDLATELKIADSQPLPTELAGTTITITDSAAQEHQAKLFFVSSGQINYLMPETVTLGKATVMVKSGSGHTSVSTVDITQVAPALFSANSTGQGVATALVVRVKANGQQVYEQVTQYDSGVGAFTAKPIDLSVPGEQVYLAFYGSGLRYRSMLGSVSLSIGGIFLNALYVGSVPGYEGLDQVNVLLPNSLAGRGDVDVLLTVDGKQSNTVKLRIK